MKDKYFSVNEAGCSVHCKLYYDDLHAIHRVIVCAHGFTGHKDNKAVERLAGYLLKKHTDVGVLVYNAPCHGDDNRPRLLLEDCLTYLEVVTRAAQKQFQTDALYAYANSFGGYQVLKYLAERGNPFRKIALRCPAVNMYEVMSANIMHPDEIKALQRNKPIAVGFDRKVKITRRFLEDLKEGDIVNSDFRPFAENILIMHGTKDEVVPFADVSAFAAQNGIRFVPVENADHRFSDPKTMDAAIKTIAAFFEL